jgi:hypothetical protein
LRYCGLDIDAATVAFNRQQGIDCVAGDAMDPATLTAFLDYDLLFFGPPLSVNCDGHQLLSFDQVTPGFMAFAALLLGELRFAGSLVFICPRTTHLGNVGALHACVRLHQPQLGLGLIHQSYSSVTGSRVVTEPRLKYVELWFSPSFIDAWEVSIGCSQTTDLLHPLHKAVA